MNGCNCGPNPDVHEPWCASQRATTAREIAEKWMAAWRRSPDLALDDVAEAAIKEATTKAVSEAVAEATKELYAQLTRMQSESNAALERHRAAMEAAQADTKRLDSGRIRLGGCCYYEQDLRAAIDAMKEGK